MISPFTIDPRQSQGLPMRNPCASSSLGPDLVKTTRVIHVGLDLGTATSRLIGVPEGEEGVGLRTISPTCVGHAKEGLVENLLPGNARVLFGKDAIRHRLHLKMVQPMIEGRVADPEAAHAFLRHLCDHAGIDAGSELRAVIGVPADASPRDRQAFREASTGIFDSLLLVPKPFLAALGMRDESRLADPDYSDPVRNSIFIDLGAGGVSGCLVQGAYPGPEGQAFSSFGGDAIDRRLAGALLEAYPDLNISPLRIRELKEQFACAGFPIAPMVAELFVRGTVTPVDLSRMLGDACRTGVDAVHSMILQLVSRADEASVPDLVQNVFLTGGGAQLRSMDEELSRLLRESGLKDVRVSRMLEAGPESFVALGALKAARQARPDQWHRLSPGLD